MMLCHSDALTQPIIDPRPELNYRTVNGKLRFIWESLPEREGIVFYDDDDERTSLKNEEIKLLAMKCASLMRSHGVKKGDIVCNLLPGSMEREVVNFAILMAGAVVMHGDVINDVGHHFWTPIHQAGVRHIVVEPTDDSPGWKMLQDDIGPSGADIEKSTIEEVPLLDKVFKFRLQHHSKNENVKTAFELIKEHGGMFMERLCSHDPAAIFVAKCPLQKHYKLVLRNHSQLCQIAHRVEDMFNIIPDDVVYNDWPVSWLTGLPFCYISTGCTMVKSTLTDCPAEKVVRETWDLIEKEKCTIASLQPSMIQMLSSHCEDIPEPHWKLKVLSTTGFVRQSVMDAIGRCTDAIVTCCSLIEAGVVSRLTLTDTTKTRYTEGCVGDLTDPVRTRFDTKGPGSAKPTKVQAAQPYKRCQASFLFMAIIYSCFIGLIASEPKNAETTEIFEGDLDSPGNLSVSNTVKALKEMLFQERKESKKLIKAYQDSLIQIKHDIFKEIKQLQEVDVPEKTEPTAPPQTKNGNKNTITISLVVLNGILCLCCAICVVVAVVRIYFYARTLLQFGELFLPAQRQKLAKTFFSAIFTAVFCGVVLGVTLRLLLNF